MPRRLLILSLWLLAGAVANVGVTMGLAFVDLPRIHADNLGDTEFLSFWDSCDALLWSATGRERVVVRHLSFRGGAWEPSEEAIHDWVPAWSLPTLTTVYRTGDELEQEGRSHASQWVADARGWPVLACRGGALQMQPRAAWIGSSARIGRVHRIANASRPWFLPYEPIWPGFLINTLFYAVLACLLTLGPASLRRHLRRRRGLCPKCAYSMSGTAVCSECGHELARVATWSTASSSCPSSSWPAPS